ncbi:MAG: hypothetical protein AB9866_12540 [Syntrophobacteraceae bacterium]
MGKCRPHMSDGLRSAPPILICVRGLHGAEGHAMGTTVLDKFALQPSGCVHPLERVGISRGETEGMEGILPHNKGIDQGNSASGPFRGVLGPRGHGFQLDGAGEESMQICVDAE